MEVPLDGREQEIADYIHPKRLDYLENWDEVSKMLLKVTSKDFRFKYADKFNNPLTYSWFVIDIVGYKNNPRSKSIGFHSVFDNFNNIVKNKYNDVVGWHFHTVPANQNAIEYNTCWTNNDFHEQSICRRLIERNTYTSIFRAGGHIERNDLSFWLEQFIPFDFSCRSYDINSNTQYNPGDINDWRGAPTDWSSYNPNFYDYRKKGNMNRNIFRTLDIDSNACQLNEYEVEKAFRRAMHLPTVISVSTHDRRDFSKEVENVMLLINKVANKYPCVTWLHSNALDAARACLEINIPNTKPSFDFTLQDNILNINSNFDLFGSFPFLAIQERENLFYRDNVTIESPRHWVYKIPKLRNIKKIAVAGSDKCGQQAIKTITL